METKIWIRKNMDGTVSVRRGEIKRNGEIISSKTIIKLPQEIVEIIKK